MDEDPLDTLIAASKSSASAPDPLDVLKSAPQTPIGAVELAKDPTFDPVQYAKGFDSPPQIARDVFQLRQNGGGPQTSVLQKGVGAVEGLGEGLLNVAKLPYYAGQTAWNAGKAIGADDDKSKLTNMIAAQESENRLGGAWDALTGPNSSLRRAGAAYMDPNQLIPQQAAPIPADVDAQFSQLVARAKTQDALESGKAQDTMPGSNGGPGVAGAIARGAYGLGQIKSAAESAALNPATASTNPISAYAPPPASQIVPSPQDLSEQGTPWTAADAQTSGNISQAADPSMLLPLHMPGSELAQKMAGRIVQAGGEALSAAEPFVSYGAKKAAPAYIAGATMYGGPLVGLKAAALGGASWLGGKVIGKLGQTLQDVGGEAATGVPGDLSTRLGQAAVTGASDLSAAMQKRLGQAAVGSIAAPIAMAPLNALITNGDPEQFGAAEGGAAGIGGMAGASGFRFRPEILSQADAYLQRQGAQPTGNKPMDAMHAAGMAQLSPDDAARVNALRGVFQGMPVETESGKKASANIYALTPQDFAAELQRRGVAGSPQELAQQKGYYDGGTGQALINTGAGDAAGTGAHESGHIGEQVLDLMGQNGSPLHSAMMDTLGQGLITNGQPNRLFQRFIDQYKTGATPEIQALPSTDPYWKKEFLADTVQRVIGQNGIADSAVPKALSDKILSNLGQFWGRMTGTSGSFSTSNPTQVRAINDAATDMLRTLAGAKFRTGFGDLQPGQGAPAPNILDAVSGKAAPTPAPPPPAAPPQNGVSPDVAKAMKSLGVKPGGKYTELQRKIEEALNRTKNVTKSVSDSAQVEPAQPVTSDKISDNSGVNSVPEEPMGFGELHTWQQTEAPQTPAKRVADAVAKIPQDALGLKKVTDRFGRTKIAGDIDPANPIHQQILAISGIDQNPDALANLQKLQAAKGRVQYVEYKSGEDLGGEHNAEKRRIDYEASSAQDRLAGTGGVTEQQNKAFIPLSTAVTKEGRVLSTGYSPDKLHSNIALIATAAVKAGIPVKFDPSDVQTAIENHAHGYKGDGSGPFISEVTPKPDPSFTPKRIPPDRYQIVNMAMQETGATKGGSSRVATRGKAQEARALTLENSGLGRSASHVLGVSPVSDSGEVNPLRAKLRAAGFDADKQLESPFENLYPELMTSVSDTPGNQDIVRPNFKGDIRQVFAKGIPNSVMARSGFKPKSLAENSTSSQNKSDEISQGNPLESAAAYVGGSARATPQHDDDWPTREGRSADEAKRLEEWAKANGKLGGPSITEQKRGSEHIVHFDESSGRWGKQTRPESGDGFGIALTNTGQGATPGEYLDRLTLNNKIFNDDVRLERVVKNGGKLSIITSQPDISGREATNPEIDASMAERGFRKIAPGIFYGTGENEGVLVHDMVPRNAIFSNGRAVPIDPAIQRATPELANFIHTRGGFSSASNRSLQSEMLKARVEPMLRLRAAMAERRSRTFH